MWGGGGRAGIISRKFFGMLTNEERKYAKIVLKNFIIISSCSQEDERNKT